ncbi:MAG: RHS repeat-associated core domain-containing protein [Dehalococcoidia bacterium]|nr:RHS repeat-associated core domain-containing protein [Dehalococcoidia bacterium]
MYGTPSKTGSLANEFDFAGQQTDGTGLQYLRARYYDPGTGTFLSRDPISTVPGSTLNAYGYADQSPSLMTDPSGLFSVWPVGPGGTCFLGIGICKHGPPPTVDDECSYWYAYTAPPQCKEQVERLEKWLDDNLPALTGIVGEYPKGGSGYSDAPKKVTGWTKHGIVQALTKDGHGVNTTAIEGALNNPTKVVRVVNRKTGEVSFQWIGKHATVVLNKAGEIVTVWANGKAGYRY